MSSRNRAETAVDLAAARTAMSKPLSKASEGGYIDVLWEREDITQSEVRLVSGKHVLVGLKVRPGRRFSRRDYA
jgi:hypothetical protein